MTNEKPATTKNFFVLSIKIAHQSPLWVLPENPGSTASGRNLADSDEPRVQQRAYVSCGSASRHFTPALPAGHPIMGDRATRSQKTGTGTIMLQHAINTGQPGQAVLPGRPIY
jgi:hypothetical protein